MKDREHDLDKLKAFLRHKKVKLDLEETYTRFQEETGPSSDEDFLSYMHRKKLIDHGTYCAAHAENDIEVTGASGASSLVESIRYDLFDIIAEGAMGEIVLGRDRDLRRKVAIKVLKREHMSTPIMRRFITEAQVTAQLDHPNIIPVYSLEVDAEGNVSFAMKLIQGHTLKDYINEMLDALELEGPGELNRRFPLLNRLEMLLRVCDAISYAHQRGVIHRDLKPANVMIGAFGEVYVMDWGIARLIRNDREAETLWIESGGEGLEERHVEHTRSGQVVGTPRYMSPEQARGENEFLDARTDLYVIGLMLYELVTLRKALSGDTLDKVLDRAAAGRVGPVEHRHSREHIPRPLRAIIRKAVAKQPDSRYQTVAELADDIRRFIRGEAVAAMPDTPVQAVYRWMGRHHALTLSMVLGIAVVAAVAVSWSLYAQMNAMEQARLREDRFTRFQANVDAVAHRIDTHFLRFQNILMLLADTVSWQISHGRPDEGHIYTLEAFQRESRQPPDFAFAPAYSQHVSFAHAVFILPSGKTGYDRELLRRLAPLSAGFRKALLDSRMQRRTLHPEEWRRQLAVQGTPIQWAYAALTNGLFIGYPGSGNYPDHFDPRARPWFRTGRNHREPVWSDPYMDAAVDHRVLSCAVSFYREDGSLQGVTAMDVPLKVAVRRIMDTLVLLPGHRACMLDEQGRVLACSDAGDSAQQGKEYPYPQLIKAMRRRDSGILLQPRGGDTLIYAYRRVETVRWYYVEWMRIRELLQQHDPSSGG